MAITKMSRTASLKRDDMIAKKKAVRVVKSKLSNTTERARGLQRSGSMQGKKASINSKTKKYSM